MELRTWKCSVHECEEQYTEVSDGIGFPGWGIIEGISSPEGDRAHICPKHIGIIVKVLNGEVR